MRHIGLAFVEIALHRRGPEDLPASRFLLATVLIVYLVIGLASLQISEPVSRAAGLLLFDSILYLGFIWGLLHLFGYRRRFPQTATALLGAETFLNLIGIPLLAWMQAARVAGNTAESPTFLFLLLFVWSVDVAAYILSRALGRPYVLGVAIVIVYVLGSITLRELLFPVTD